MKEMFMEMYKLYDKYHNQKEQMIWLASTVYLGFSVAVIDWLFKNQHHWKSGPILLMCVGLGMVCACATMFVVAQNRYKVGAVHVTNKLNALLPKFDAPNGGPTSEDLRQAINAPNLLCPSQKRRAFFQEGFTGAICVILMGMLGIAQVVVVVLLSDCWRFLLACMCRAWR
jgi:hypothetical protein